MKDYHLHQLSGKESVTSIGRPAITKSSEQEILIAEQRLFHPLMKKATAPTPQAPLQGILCQTRMRSGMPTARLLAWHRLLTWQFIKYVPNLVARTLTY